MLRGVFAYTKGKSEVFRAHSALEFLSKKSLPLPYIGQPALKPLFDSSRTRSLFIISVERMDGRNPNDEKCSTCSLILPLLYPVV
jgi:hypothetical protein